MARFLQNNASSPFAENSDCGRESRDYVKNRHVEFHIQDVYYPDKTAVLEELHGKDLLQGRVVETTKGPKGEMYAVIEVEGLGQPVIVPVRCVKQKL